MKKMMGIMTFGLCVSLCMVVEGTMWHVDGSVAVSRDGRSWETAFTTIQEGIDAASEGDAVMVAQGAYLENIKFNGKNITLTSTDPLDPSIVATTIIDGNNAGSVVTFFGTEDETCVLAGFTIRNGNAPYEYGGFGGGIYGGGMSPMEKAAHATIRNNVITGNSAYRGGGIALCDGRIVGNKIISNTAGRGGGLRYCHGIIENNIIAANTSTGEGAAGLDHCDGIIQNNVISGNSGPYSDSEGGLNGCNGIIQNNLITGNSCRGYAAGLTFCLGIIVNNTIVGNSVAGGEAMAGGLVGCAGIIRNCIIWGNSAPDGVQLKDCSEPAYCCIQNWSGGGVGNTNEDPVFVARGSDYHVQSDSPCINGGVNYYWAAWPQRDLDGGCRLEGERVDMGCYEYDSFLDSDGDLLEDDDELDAGTDPADDDTDDDGLRDGLELLRKTDPLAPNEAGTVRVPSELATVQAALCLAFSGDEIVVTTGAYRENLQFCGTDVLLRSSDPNNDEIVSSTILDGGGTGPVVSFTGSESEDCVLSGFTIRNGNAGMGGGIHGGGEYHLTRATIRNNVITQNSAGLWGGGLAFCDGLIDGNTISENSAADGGGLCWCHGTIQNNLISANSSRSQGGGLYEFHGIIRNNTIIGNSAQWRGGGLSSCSGTIVNCIIWGNTAEDGPQLYNCVRPTYSCIQDWTGGGEGNIAEAPRFIGAENGDFRLLADSPCIDAGYNVPDLSETDIAARHRIMYGGKSLTVDIGAYEFYINDLTPGPNPDHATFTWSSLADRTYSIFYTDDLLAWHLADGNIRSAGDMTTSWIDDGSLTGLPPSLARRRFYRVLENP